MRPSPNATVFAVTVVAGVGRTRCWGVAPTFDDAENAVLRNVTDLAEREYVHAVIEEVYFSIPSFVVHGREWWYVWEGSWGDGAYRPTTKPTDFQSIVGWGIG